MSDSEIPTRVAAPHQPDGALDGVRRALLELSMQEQELPPERELAARLGVPRSRLRRALAELRDTGQLAPARVGRRAARRDTSRVDALARVANPTDVIELRVLLEPQFARLAAVRASALESARIVRVAAGRPGDGYAEADLAFHQELARASRNPLAAELYWLLREVGTDARVRLPLPRPACPERREARDAEHMEIARAVAERDPDRAEAAMRAHLANVQRLIHARLSPPDGDDPAEDRATGLGR